MQPRASRWTQTETTLYDAIIIGGGINGACLYWHLGARGYRVLLLDRGDFGGGTSQASAMMIWGGLLYLRNLAFAAVAKFSRARDQMITQFADGVRPEVFRYVPATAGGRHPWLVRAALELYWLLGLGARRRPRAETEFAESVLVRNPGPDGALTYEEAVLRQADCRFVLDWVCSQAAPGCVALNYADVVSGGYHPADRLWHLDVVDRLTGRATVARARLVVNCAGVWTDTVNARFGISSPWRHVLSKGVWINLRRPPELSSPLIFETGHDGDVITLLPWGPIAAWGPTETVAADLASGLHTEPADVTWLLDQAHRLLRRPVRATDVLSFRCGIRPLVVPAAALGRVHCSLDLSRQARIQVDADVPWVSTYGGKITGCIPLAEQLAATLARRLPVPAGRPVPPPSFAPPATTDELTFPGLAEPVPTPAWCAQHEYCCTLTDYLRRRTNIAQWVPRAGLGARHEHVPLLRRLARALTPDDAAAAAAVAAYTHDVEREFTRALGPHLTPRDLTCTPVPPSLAASRR